MLIKTSRPGCGASNPHGVLVVRHAGKSMSPSRKPTLLLFVFIFFFIHACSGQGTENKNTTSQTETTEDTNKTDTFKPGYTNLLHAVKYGDIESAEHLLENGGDVELSDKYDNTLLMLASNYGKTDMVELLLDYDADVDRFVEEIKYNTDGMGYDGTAGHSALLAASSRGHADVIELLLDYRANISQKDPSGNTALMNAAAFSYAETVEVLLNNGAHTNDTNNAGHTALYIMQSNLLVNEKYKRTQELIENAGGQSF